MNENSRNVVGVDIGTSKVRVIIANFDKEGMPNVIGVGSAENNGMKKGVITNAQSVYQALDKALLQAERMAGYESSSAIFSVSGAHILSTNTDGMIAINSPDGIVDEEDLQRVPNVKDLNNIKKNILAIEGVVSIKNVHFWSLDGEEHVFTAQIIVNDFSKNVEIRRKISSFLPDFQIVDSTIEILKK